MLRYFIRDEFDCPCCGENFMEMSFLHMLDNARHLAGIPFHITSGYRCLRHNFEVNGSSTSSHLIGLASDIECKTSGDRFKMLDALIRVGIKRIGVRVDFVHADFDLMKDQGVFWLY